MGPVLRLCSPLFSCLYRLVTTILAGLVTSHGHGAQTGAGVPVETVAFRRIRLFFFWFSKTLQGATFTLPMATGGSGGQRKTLAQS